MPRQLDLFADKIPEGDQQPQTSQATSLKLSIQTDRLSPAQQQFNKLLERIEKLKNQLTALQQVCDTHRPVFHQKMAPLRQQQQKLLREMVLWLDRRLLRKGLTAAQRSGAAMIVCELSRQLVVEGDEEMRAFYDKHSDMTFDEMEKNSAEVLREAMEDMLGESFADDESLDSVEDVLRASMERMKEAEETKHEVHQAKKRKKKPSASQLKSQAEQADAETALRKIFRQLASALHPDRENDPDERVRKTALMSEANAAYERRDLIVLLQIQLRTELASPDAIAKLAEEKLAPLALLLKQQAKDLDRELQICRQKARQEFGLGRFETVSIFNLNGSLLRKVIAMKKELAAMQHDFQHIEDDKYFKRWLKAQEQSMNDMFAEAMFSGEFDPFGR